MTNDTEESKITTDDEQYLNDLVMHFLSMIGEYEHNTGYSMCFQTQINTKDGRILQVNLLAEDEYEKK